MARYDTAMRNHLTIDDVGRIVIPKAVRQRLRLSPGDALELHSDDDHLVLTPIRPKTPMIKKQGIWIHSPNGSLAEDSILETIELVRNERISELSP